MNTIIYNCYSSDAGMSKYTLNLEDIICYLPKTYCRLVTNIKLHCWEKDEFVINIKDGKIVNKDIVSKINDYIEKNNTRSFFYEGLMSLGNGKYGLLWGS